MLELVYEESREKMEKSISHLQQDLLRIRTGRASQSLLDGIRVDYYGTPTPISQMATISVPESRLITIAPWDASVINDVEKAILKSDLGLTPNNDGKIIRISIPALTEQRRKELVKVINKMCEEQKVAVRNIRREANENLKKFKKDGDITEDEMFKGQDEVQKITNEHIEKIDKVCQAKEKEILEF
ncbi:MAG: ribosome recycling factor [Desulfatibacillaceae bacterium]|nr:ribosome recycling factor [Desulfatibacillaceae bacterium]